MTIPSNGLSVFRSAGLMLRNVLRFASLLFAGSVCSVPVHGQCPTNVASGANLLDVNGVRAWLNASELQFFNGGYFDRPFYEVPVGAGTQSLYATILMIGGRISGQTRTIRARYGGETHPGPIDESGNPSNDCQRFNRVYRVSLADIGEYERSGVATSDVLEWPWDAGAPVRDGDGIPDNYDLEAGDRPAIEGHQMLWWVVNDKLTGEPSPYHASIGLEIAVSAFAAASDDPVVDYATFYRYRLTHWGEAPLVDAYFGQYVEPDIGGSNDDLMGSDTTLGLAFGYNGDDFDEGSRQGRGGYGDRPPAIGVVVLDGIRADDDGLDNDKDGLVDQVDERLPMSKFVVWERNQTEFGNPVTDDDFYGYLRGLRRDGVPITYGGSGVGYTQTPIDFMYPGDPPDYWSMENLDSSGTGYTPTDFHFMWSTGPFSLDVGESTELVVAYLWAQGDDRYDSIRKLKEAVPTLREYWADGFQIPLPDPPSEVPQLYAPDNRSANQPTNLRLSWRMQPGHERHELQLSRDPDFMFVIDSAFVTAPEADFELADDALYYWRVRGVNAAGPGPWSETWSFSTGSIAQISPGVLTVEDEFGGDRLAFIQIAAGAGENDPCSPEAESRFGCDQVGGNLVHGSFNAARTWILYNAGSGPGNTIGRFAPHDFELRFTEEGSYAYHAQTTGRVIHVPFEAWDVGDVGPFGTNDPSDDEQLIPGVYSDNDGECFFGFGETADDPFNLGWPVTDRVYAYYPAEEGTYDAWRGAVEPLVEAHADRCPVPTPGDSVSNLVNVDRMPLQNLIFMMDPVSGNYRPEGIPTGNVIRLLTTRPTPPITSAPINDAEFYVGGALGNLSFWWQLPPGVADSRLQVNRSRANGSEVVLDTVVSGGTFELTDLPLGYYSWRVGYSNESVFWSEPSTFAVLSFLSAENDVGEIPTRLSVRQPYPNPTSDVTHFDIGLPTNGHVSLTAFDLLGRRVATLADTPMTAGWRTVDWNTADVSNGVYVVRVEAGKTAVSTKVVVVR